MRHDDMIDTVLRAETVSENQCAIVWSQLSDLLAQKGDEISQFDATAALTLLSQIKTKVPVEHRSATARAIARRCHFVPLVAFYGGDVAPVALALLAEVRLTDQEWLTFIPLTTPLARSILRQRRDLSSDVERALQVFGALDFRLGTSVEIVAPIAPSAASARAPEYLPISVPVAPSEMESVAASSMELDGTQISELVRRIEAYKADRQVQPTVAGTQEMPMGDAPFQFETGPDGTISWTDVMYRGAVIGVSIAEPAFDRESGTDAYSADAFRRRTHISNARLFLEGEGRLAGDWRFSAKPMLNPGNGQFLGYRGSARRPRRGETATPVVVSKILGSAIFGESMRQLVHELGTPLNAISGFAQIIDGQMFGPVPHRYRTMADEIIADSARLMAIFSDLDLAARIDSDCLETRTDTVAMEQLIDELADELDRVSDRCKARLRIQLSDELPMMEIDSVHARRLVGRFLSALIEVAAPGEAVSANISQVTGGVRISVQRPISLKRVPAATLLDPGYSPEGDAPDAAMLSFGFSLRLVINFAKAVGGRLEVASDSLMLVLPTEQQQRRDSQSQ